jgi:membrane dipeptidase
MTSNRGETHQPGAGYLDAAAPLIQPRDLRRLVPELEEGRVTAALATVASIQDSRFAVGLIGEWLNLERSGTIPFRIVRAASEVDEARSSGQLAVILHFQGAQPIEDQLSLLDVYAALGVRVIQLTYNFRNRLGDGCLEPSDAGLSKFGRAAIAAMNDLGVVVDLAHVGERTSLEAVAASRSPVVVTHGNASAVHQSKRNLTDAQIAAVAQSGGVIGACAFPAFVGPGSPPDIQAFVDHIDYLVEKAGIDHVGIGLDFAQENEGDYEYYGYEEDTYPRPPWVYPAGIGSFSEVRNLGPALARRGYTPAQIEAIAGANFLRVFQQVWPK